MDRKIWTSEEDAIMCANYPRDLTRNIANILGRTESSVANRAHTLGLIKNEHILKYHRFSKGNIPHNKGRRREEYMTKEGIARCVKTAFAKGHVPHNAKSEGEIVIRKRNDRDEPPYKMIKVPGERKLKPLHRHIWEQANGPIPNGFNLIFKDRNTMNCELPNLALVSNSQLMEMNTIHRYPPELKAAIKSINKLQKEINHVKKHDFRP